MMTKLMQWKVDLRLVSVELSLLRVIAAFVSFLIIAIYFNAKGHLFASVISWVFVRLHPQIYGHNILIYNKISNIKCAYYYSLPNIDA
jgi:hypothetical protein